MPDALPGQCRMGNNPHFPSLVPFHAGKRVGTTSTFESGKSQNFFHCSIFIVLTLRNGGPRENFTMELEQVLTDAVRDRLCICDKSNDKYKNTPARETA